MGDGEPSLQLADVTTALNTALTALKAVDPSTEYRVVGTSAALLQGVHLPVGDIDLLAAQRENVDTFATALSSFPCLYPASLLPKASQYFVNYDVDGVAVSMSTVEKQADSDGMECVGHGPWRHYVLVTCGSHRVPVVRLELRLVTELLRDRPDRYEPLLGHMSVHGYDAQLLEQAMNARPLPTERQRLVQEHLDYSFP
ncbi:hypothetical protein AB0I81_54615 [Nonomuraea sp. NPDC050404]|uniref:hypothetical protein n=1 Tax=Nonomuraea sp. NPDC050404 TaxID=3155783 RepID=UPI0033ED4A5C